MITRRRRVAPRAPRRPFTIAVTADWAPIRAFEPSMRATPASIYGDLLTPLHRADLRIVNCECALTASTQAVTKSGAVFKGAPEHALALSAVPFDVACLANNHVLDYGVAGLRETVRVLNRSGIQTVGAGLDATEAYAALTLRRRGQVVHVVNLCEGEDETASRGGPGVFGWDVQRAVDLIGACKARGGVVLAIAHCGLEYVPFPPGYVVNAFRALADAGADAVIGHHPHVPQGAEWRGGTPIFYSLGNFAFYQPTNLHYRKLGYFVSLTFTDNQLSAAELHPYRISDQGLRSLDPRETETFCRDMARLSAPFASVRGPELAWQAYLEAYGAAGFEAEVTGILERMRQDPHKGAAMFRNRVTTLQHSELWRTYLTRAMAATPSATLARDRAVIRDYASRTV